MTVTKATCGLARRFMSAVGRRSFELFVPRTTPGVGIAVGVPRGPPVCGSHGRKRLSQAGSDFTR